MRSLEGAREAGAPMDLDAERMAEVSGVGPGVTELCKSALPVNRRMSASRSCATHKLDSLQCSYLTLFGSKTSRYYA